MRDRWEEWVRSEGNFYSDFIKYTDTVGRSHYHYRYFPCISVTYSYVTLSTVPLKSITIDYRDNSELYIVLGISPRFIDDATLSAKKYFTFVDQNMTYGSVSLYRGK